MYRKIGKQRALLAIRSKKANNKKCLSIKTATNKQIHDYALNWKVDRMNTIFENFMPVRQDELEYKALVYDENELKNAIEFCGQVRIDLKFSSF